MLKPRIHLGWKEPSLDGYRTAVSLHSHTSHSRETLDFIPRMLAGKPVLTSILKRYEERYRQLHGRELNYMDAWWTPPLGPKEAMGVERAQIESLGLEALVSLTDHDNIEAPMLLRVLSETRDAPVSVEWTVPYRGTYFHLGVHNMGPRRAPVKMAAMARFTAAPAEPELRGILDWLAEDEETLLVFNHPLWDEKGGGQARHDELAQAFLKQHKPWLHALEMNGIRPWSENRRVMEWGGRVELPVVSGGDRHGAEPNAVLNVTAARTMAEFVDEVRCEQRSSILVMPQYREPLTGRVLAAIGDVMRDNERHTHGWTTWSDRVFYRDRASGEVRALRQAFEVGKEPALIRLFVAGVRMLEHRHVKLAVRQALPAAQEVRL